MSSYLLIHGASSNGGYWRHVQSLLHAAGHSSTAVDLPSSDPAADFDDYADAACAQAPADVDVVVGQSLGAFTAALVADRLQPQQIILVAPMIPTSGESPLQWAAAVGQAEAVQHYAEVQGIPAAFDPVTTFFHDVPAQTTAALWAEGEPEQAAQILQQPFPLSRWPLIPTRVLAGTDDRLIPWELQCRVALDRLGVHAEALPTGHLPALARPDLLTQRLLSR